MVGLVVSLVDGASSKAPISTQIDELSILLCLHLHASWLGLLGLALEADMMLSSMEALARCEDLARWFTIGRGDCTPRSL